MGSDIRSADILLRLKGWDRCYPENLNIELMVNDAAAEIERLRNDGPPAVSDAQIEAGGQAIERRANGIITGQVACNLAYAVLVAVRHEWLGRHRAGGHGAVRWLSVFPPDAAVQRRDHRDGTPPAYRFRGIVVGSYRNPVTGQPGAVVSLDHDPGCVQIFPDYMLEARDDD